MMHYDQSHRWRILNFSWIAFCSTFFAWFAFAPLAPLIQTELRLSDSQIGWLATAGVALTIPGRVWIGRLVDRFGPRRTYAILLAVLALPVALLGFARTFGQLLALRLVVGLVGCGFVIGIRLIGDWFPRRQLGLAEGIYAGCGNAGSALAALALPIVAINFGWRAAMVAAAVPMLLWAGIFWRGVRDVPAGKIFRRTPAESSFSPWGDRRARILAIAYLACFGSELCVVAFLPKFFHDKFEMGLVGAGMFAAVFGGLNILARPMGGWMADRWGRKKILLGLLCGMCAGYLFLGFAPTLPLAFAAIIVASIFVQSAEGAVFAIVPIVSPTDTGRVAGFVGAAGNVGGLIFPLVFGYGLQWSGGSYLPGFIAVSLGAVVAFVAMLRFQLPDNDLDQAPGFAFRDEASHWGPISMTATRPST